METKKIITFTKLEKKIVENASKIPEDYVEIIPKYLEIYQGCWVKYSCKDSGLSYPGGYLIEITEDNVAIIRNIRRDIFERNIAGNIFYCKQDTPNHRAVKAIIEERDRLSIKIKEFNVQKQNFINKRRNTFIES
jgi:hypothetical protein